MNYTRSLAEILLTCGLLLSAASTVARAADAKESEPQTGQHAYTYEAKGEKPASIGYLLYLPADYNKQADKKWPVMLFLHGSGERGDGKADLDRVKIHGPPKFAEARNLQMIVISPQCPNGVWWDPTMLKGLLDEVMTKYRTDADRVYLTGLSMGGFGTWSMAAKYPDMFAAINPICGGVSRASEVESTAEKIKKLPIWVFHGEEDKAVSIEKSQELVDALKKAGATDLQFTRYPGVGHDSWVKAYDDPKLWEWFLSHHRAH